MYPPEWKSALVRLRADSADIVEVLQGVRAEYPEFGAERMRASMALRESLGLPVRQLHMVVGWLEGNIDDDALRAAVPLTEA
ncbi:hypothetical protein [Amycolatopsis sp. YIM 10]|uniref:hypothetical protein n=1 Tax=Amycolatopsis sp. YIM 10 TaxID=2653857 RepID=UPI0012905776|nr:hypothetical protein [Amycolatopsis sp. YIM 10]QFU86366.1 hypothetical protein YIM_05740 [Amycolatopsis sp. YIM 10]